MYKKLSPEHKAVILGTIEEELQHLESHLDEAIGVGRKPCRVTKMEKTGQKKK